MIDERSGEELTAVVHTGPAATIAAPVAIAGTSTAVERNGLGQGSHVRGTRQRGGGRQRSAR